MGPLAPFGIAVMTEGYHVMDLGSTEFVSVFPQFEQYFGCWWISNSGHDNPQAHAICDSWGSHSGAVQDPGALGFLKTSFSHITWLHLVLNWRQLTLC